MPKFDYIASLLLNALRKYNIPDIIIGGDRDCKHEWGNIIPPRGKSNWASFAKYRYASGGDKQGNLESYKINHGGFCIHCQSWKGQYGLEPTPQMYVEHTRLWAKEAWRVLRKDGVFFLNIADSYSGSGCGTNDYRTEASKSIQGIGKNKDLYKTGGITQKLKDYPKKCQLLIPHRVAISLVDDGWCLRNTIVWYRTNSMPESVTDRFSKKYEYVFFFTKSPKYYFDLDSVREPHKQVSIDKLDRAVSNKNKYVNGADGQTKHGLSQPRPNIKHDAAVNRTGSYDDPLHRKAFHPLGKNPGDVFIIPTQPSNLSHYAQWPERLVERMVRCSTKAGDTVLDPFCGSGCTLKVAEELQRVGVGIDLGYHAISKKRTANVQKKMFV